MPVEAGPAGLRLGLADEGQVEIYDELLQAIEAAAADIGISATRVRRPAEERAVDVLLLVGRLFRFRRLMAGDKTSHRVWWYGENLPIQAPAVSERMRSRLPRRLTLLGHRAAALAGGRAGDAVAAWRERAVIDRELVDNLRELGRARTVRLIDELVVTSPNRARGAALAGWETRTLPFGYHPALAGEMRPPAAEREIPVLMFGRASASTPGRLRMLATLGDRLGTDLPVHVVERGLYGARRHELLARTRIVLHLHRVPHLSSALRYVLASAAGAAFVGEASDDDWLPNRPSYLVEARLEDLADAVMQLANDEVRRQRLVNESQRLLASEWSMANSLASLLAGLTGVAAAAGRRA
jgi:hypothetical protein